MKCKYKIIWLDTIDSTNNEVLRQIPTLDNLTTIATILQTDGRGQRGNKWLSKPGENLTFSVFFKALPYKINAVNQFIISQIATITVKDYIESQGISCKIKWPNDIYVRNKKICGMLIENSLRVNYVNNSIIGIGINVNQVLFPAELLNPTSMRLITKQEYDIKAELPKILNILYNYIQLLNTDEGREYINRLYSASLYRLGRSYEYRDNIQECNFIGTIIGVNNEGKVQIKTNDSIKEYGFKEISYII